MKIHLYQVVMLGISALMLFRGLRDYFKKETGQTFPKLFVRLMVWGGMAVIAIYPNSTRIFAKILGVEDNINAAVMIGFLLVFLIIFKLLSAIEKIEQNISEITRREALSHLPDSQFQKIKE